MTIYNLTEYSDAYLKTSGSSQQYCRSEPSLNVYSNIIDFLANENNSISFKYTLQCSKLKSGIKDGTEVISNLL